MQRANVRVALPSFASMVTTSKDGRNLEMSHSIVDMEQQTSASDFAAVFASGVSSAIIRRVVDRLGHSLTACLFDDWHDFFLSEEHTPKSTRLSPRSCVLPVTLFAFGC